MKCSLRGVRFVVGVVTLIMLGGIVNAALEVPLPFPAPMRQPRAPFYGNTIRDWHIFTDANTDGILNPGDRRVNRMDNWWTGVSSGTQHTSVKNGDRVNTAPMNHASDSTPGADNYWLPRANRSIHFYMAYSQMDNNPASQYDTWLPPEYGRFMAERHGDTDGWAFGWVINDYVNGTSKGPSLGDFDMDVLVHNGKSPLGQTEWISNPQISSSNHISDLAMDSQGNRVPAKWNDVTKAYDAAANPEYMNFYGKTGAEIVAIGQSMEVHEENPYGTTVDNDSIWANGTGRTPNEIFANPALRDTHGAPYTYDDAFFNRNELFQDESLGGVIAGLAGMDNYDPEVNNWGDQQVIRIDLGQDALRQVDEIVMYDFGYAPGSDQLSPIEIVFGVTDFGGERRVFYDFDGDGFDVGDLLPENRIYIAQVNVTPEPISAALLGFGGLGLLLRRRKNRA